MNPSDPMPQAEYREALMILYGTTRANVKLAEYIGASHSLLAKASSGVTQLTGPYAFLIRVLAWPERFMIIRPKTGADQTT